MEWQKKVNTPIALLVVFLVGVGAWYLVQGSLSTGLPKVVDDISSSISDLSSATEVDELEVVPTVTNQASAPITLPEDWKLVSGDLSDVCTSPTFEGKASISGWLTYGGNELSKEWLFQVREVDRDKLPMSSVVDTTTSQSVNALIRLDDIPQNSIQKIRLATPEEPVSITVQGYSLYCEGSPTVRFQPFPPIEDPEELDGEVTE